MSALDVLCGNMNFEFVNGKEEDCYKFFRVKCIFNTLEKMEAEAVCNMNRIRTSILFQYC